MAYNLRIPPALDLEARGRCERLGISLNALICVALDAYLRQPVAEPAGTASALPAVALPAAAYDAALPVAPANLPGKLSKQQRRQFTAAQREAKKH